MVCRVKPFPKKIKYALTTLLCSTLLWLLISVNWHMWRKRGSSCFQWIFIVALTTVVAGAISICQYLPDRIGEPLFELIVAFYILVLIPRSIYLQVKLNRLLSSLKVQKRKIAEVKRAKMNKGKL